MMDINLQIVVKKDGKTPGKQFYMKNILQILDKSDVISHHKNAFISRTVEYFDMRFFANIIFEDLSTWPIKIGGHLAVSVPL